MPEPKKRTTKSRQGMRRGHISLKAKAIKKCSQCGVPALPHLMCKSCGYYRGRKVVDYTAAAVESVKKPAAKKDEEKAEKKAAPKSEKSAKKSVSKKKSTK